MAIRFSSQNGNFELDLCQRFSAWIEEVVEMRGKRVGNINYLFCTDDYLIEINRKFLNHDTYTDIITFDSVVGNLVSGDIMISTDRVGENAEHLGVTFEQELSRVVIHGVLHLLGQGDKSDDEALQMRKLEDEALAVLDATSK
ncbi:MAG: rRNA maturation RNase YbeY [Bacteroidales bacterium]|nr:rRNA maturation RNase YbeY [Bacteroidales bacterium]